MTVYKPPSARKLAKVDVTLPRLFEEAQSENDKSFFSYSLINFFKHNPQRPAFLQLLKRIGAKDPDIRLAALIHEYVHTDDTPKIPFTNINWSNGSMMNKVIGEFLNISINKKEIDANLLSKEEMFTYIQHFYAYVEEHVTDEDVKDLVWGTKAKLLAEVHACLAKVNNRMRKDNLALFYSLPDDLDAIIANLEETIQSYTNINMKRTKPNLDRQRQLDTWRFILETAKATYPFDKTKIETSRGDRNNYGELCCILMAMQMAVFQIIEDKAWIVNGSKLCGIGLKHLNQDKIDRIKPEKKELFFSKLRNHLINIQHDSLYFETVKNQWQKLKIPEFIKSLDDITANAIANKNAPSLKRKLVTAGAVGAAATAAGGAAVMVGGPVLVSMGGGSSVLVGFYFAGNILKYTPLGTVGNKITEEAMALLNAVLKKAGELGGAALATLVATVIAAEETSKPIDLFTLKFLTDDELEVKKKYFEAKLAASNDIVTPKEKEHISHLYMSQQTQELPKVKWNI